MARKQVSEYGTDAIRIVRPAECVRQRPGMYIGSADARGLFCVVNRLVRGSLAEAADGRGRSVRVALAPDGSVTVVDQGRGLPPGDAVPTDLGPDTFVVGHGWAGGKPGRLWWEYGVACALSEWFDITARHGGRRYHQEFRQGEPVTPLRCLGRCRSSGLTVSFKPDPTIFGDARLDANQLRDRLRQYAFLNSGVLLAFTDVPTGRAYRFRFKDGVRAFVEHLSEGRRPLHSDVVVVRGAADGVRYEVGLRWCDGWDEAPASFANDEPTPHGGTHVTGMRAAVTRALNEHIREHLPGVRVLRGNDAPGGLVSVVAVRLADPQFMGSTRTHLRNDEARRAVEAGVGPALREYFRATPAVAGRVVRAALARPSGPPLGGAQWLNGTDPRPMLRFLGRAADRRRLTLFVAACCRLVAGTRDREFVRSLEAFAEGELSADGLRGARVRVALLSDVAAVVVARTFGVAQAVRLAAALAKGDGESRQQQAVLVRDIFGNPFLPRECEPAWRTSTVLALARAIDADGAYDRLPILADALEEAGCDECRMVDHLRGPGPHVRGCWVVDLIIRPDGVG